MKNRNIVICDIETTGLNFKTHEIIELGAIVINQSSLEVIDTLDMKIKPTHIETASKRAMEVNGYNELDWEHAESLRTAMIALTTKAKSAIFCSQNVCFDHGFVKEAFDKTSVTDFMDYHRIDLFTLSWVLLRNTDLEYFNLKSVTEYLKLEPEPEPHCAFNGALNAYEVLKKLLELNKGTQNVLHNCFPDRDDSRVSN
jgi:DNA polymerase III alpha subunit (gram-positive type)